MRIRHSVGHRVTLCSALVLILCVMLTGTAYAQTPASDQYGAKVEGIEVSAERGTQEGPAADALPNTGLSLLGVVAVGGVFVMTGLVIRRREKRHT